MCRQRGEAVTDKRTSYDDRHQKNMAENVDTRHEATSGLEYTLSRNSKRHTPHEQIYSEQNVSNGLSSDGN